MSEAANRVAICLMRLRRKPSKKFEILAAVLLQPRVAPRQICDGDRALGRVQRPRLQLITGHRSLGSQGVGRGCGVGRERGTALGVAVTVAVAVGVAVGVTGGVGVGVIVGVAVGVTVGVSVGVAVGVTVGVGVGGVALGVAVGVASDWAGAWTLTEIGEPVLKNPMFAVVSAGGAVESNRKLYNVP